MSNRNVPIVGHPYAVMWPLPYGVRAIDIVFFKQADIPADEVTKATPVTRVTFSLRQLPMALAGETFEFLAPAQWTTLESLTCMATEHQPKGKETYVASDD